MSKSSLTDPGLIFATNQAIIAARGEIAKLRLFATNFSAEAVKEGTSMKVPVFKAGAATAFDKETNNYEKAEGSIDWPEIRFDVHLKHTWQFDDRDTLATHTDLWRNAGLAGGEAIGQGIVEAVMASIDRTSVPKGEGSRNEVVFKAEGGSKLKTNVARLRASAQAVGIKARRSVLLLDSDRFAEVLDSLDANVFGGAEAVRNGAIPGLYGFKAVMECNEFSQADGENLVGAVVQEDCLAIAGRQISVGAPGSYDELGVTTDEDSGLVLTTRKHANTRTGENFATVEALFGFALLQPEKVIRLVSAATA